MADQEKGWSWWVGSNEETYSTECATREMALDIVASEYHDDGVGAFICEARQDPLDLALYFDAPSFLESADESACELIPDGGDPLFEVTPEQGEALEVAVRDAIRKWQADHGLVFTPFMFTASRNAEYLPPPGVMPGAICRRGGCAGEIEIGGPEGVVDCSCHINPPCAACVDARPRCPACGWSAAE